MDPTERPVSVGQLAQQLEPFTNDDQSNVLAAMSKTVCADLYAKELVAMERMWSLDFPVEEREAEALRPPVERDPSGTDWRLMTPTLLDVLPDFDETIEMPDGSNVAEPRADSIEPTVAVPSPFLEKPEGGESAPEPPTDTIEDSVVPSAHDTLPPELANKPVALDGPAPLGAPASLPVARPPAGSLENQPVELSGSMGVREPVVTVPLPRAPHGPTSDLGGVVPDAVVSPAPPEPPAWELRLVRLAQFACLLGAAAILFVLLAPDRPTLEVEVRGAGSSVSVDGLHTTRSGLRVEGAVPGEHRIHIAHDSGDEATITVDADEHEHVVVVIDD
jgi:hypothetical protein